MAQQLEFAEAFIGGGLGRNRRLEELHAMIEWAAIAARLSALRPPAGTGRPPYDALAMLKALYLQALYDLSDPGLEEALLDRLSFRRFCGLALDTCTPDATTSSDFATRPAKAACCKRVSTISAASSARAAC